MKLNDKRIMVDVERTPSGGIQGYVDTLPGTCFDDGTHCRSLFWYDGKIRDFKRELAEFIERDRIVACEDPDCDICHPVEEE